MIQLGNNKRLIGLLGLIIVLLLGISLLLLKPNDKVDLSNVSYDLNLKRFDSALFKMDTSNFQNELQSLKVNFPEFFEGTADEFWKRQIRDQNQRELYRQIEKKVDFKEIRADLDLLLKHYYFYYSNDRDYTVVSYVSNLDFNFPVLIEPSRQIIFLASDLYLGPNHIIYKPLDPYLAFYRNKKFISSDVAESLSILKARKDEEDYTLINDMIWWGKINYMKQKLMPKSKDDIILKYEPQKLRFCQENELELWLYFVKNELLFDTQEETKRRFIRTAPFSKFYTDFDRYTPGMIGKWLGFQIVKSYMENNPEITLQELMRDKEHQKIFTNSKYKP